MALNIFGYQLFTPREISEMASKDDRLARGFGPSDQKSFEIYFDNVYMASLYDYAYYSDTYRTIMNVHGRETFRNGADWEPRFVKKCTNDKCRLEYDHDADTCEKCGEKTREPDEASIKEVKEFFENCNENDQSVLDVMESMNPDFNVLDNGYTMVLKKYFYDPKGEIKSGKVLEIVRGDPLYLRKIISKTGRMGVDFHTDRPYMVCPEHRTRAQKGKHCATCGKMLYPAHYRTHAGAKQMFYLAGEVLHKTMYTKTIYYGFPMALTVLTKVRTLLAMDQYFYQYYGAQKSPKGLALIRTPNIASAERSWNKYIDAVKRDPHLVYPMFVPETGSGQSSKFAEYIDFMRNLDEMQYMESRTDMINRVGALFGVSPIFSADLSSASGLNNEGLEITITTRAMEASQSTYNVILRFITDQFGITDYDYKLNPPEERDEMAELQREAQEIANAEGMSRLGFAVEKMPDGTFKYDKKPEQEQPPGLPGLPGLTGSEPPAPEAPPANPGFSGSPGTVKKTMKKRKRGKHDSSPPPNSAAPKARA